MEQRVRRLWRRLLFLGYCTFEIRRIVQEAIGDSNFDLADLGQCTLAVSALEKYEKLGSEYLGLYSK
ncbi:Hypothetical protein LUCI_2887 [Lucifera butyrica]|uniref:Uncharacterized protein n=1 Tax=Lucifera butyrica TaxID=1351585 RepID=A0A498RBH3_9FIRM|nr:hypothetical protein [Lucifera butyrica]VBB07622.1 Hypothetical protein LUCI_2887 [Lucifera butyrica]